LENFLKVKLPANKKAWEDLKVHMIGMIIVDEIVERKQIGRCVFAFGKLACEYFPEYLRLAQELAVKVASGILGRRVKYDILFPSEKTGDQSVETSNAATRSCNMFAWQIDLFLLIIMLDWMEQLNLCAKTFSLANVSRVFSHFLQRWQLLGEGASEIEKGSMG